MGLALTAGVAVVVVVDTSVAVVVLLVVVAGDVTIPAIVGANDDGAVAPVASDRWADRHEGRGGECGLSEERTARDENK